jgi:hypothetical protein
MATDTRTYFFTQEADDRLRLYIVIKSGTVHKGGIYKTREQAVSRRHLQEAREVEIIENFTTYTAPDAPVLRLFASEVAR